MQSFTGHFPLYFTHEFYLNSEISIHYLCFCPFYIFLILQQIKGYRPPTAYVAGTLAANETKNKVLFASLQRRKWFLFIHIVPGNIVDFWMTFLAIEKYEFTYISPYICHFMQCEENTSTHSIRCLYLIWEGLGWGPKNILNKNYF